MKIAFIIIFLAGLFYLGLPSPRSVDDFSPLPGSLKSDEPGDTYQNLGAAAFFSNLRRDYVARFYKDNLQSLSIKYFPPIRLNHPPELANQYIRDQQLTTFLEEYTYPLRESIFINGYEPFDESGKPFHRGITNIVVGNTFYDSKTTIKYYASEVYVRIITYLGIWVCSILIFKLFKKSLKEF